MRVFVAFHFNIVMGMFAVTVLSESIDLFDTQHYS